MNRVIEAVILKRSFLGVVSAVVVSSLIVGCEVKESDLLLGDFSLDTPIAYVKRPVSAMIQFDPRTNASLHPGGDLYIRNLADDTEFNVTTALTAINDANADGDINDDGDKAAGDVMSPNISYDGTSIVFAMHEGLIVGAQGAAQNTWDIWKYTFDPENIQASGVLVNLSKVETSIANGVDVDPTYLPDGRIVFSSERQLGASAVHGQLNISPAVYQDEQQSEIALNLHTMNFDGTQIRQISYNQSDDRFPTVIHTGEIVFSRWERLGRNQFDLFKVNPDGSGMQILYGAHSHSTATSERVFLKAREMADGRIMTMLMPYSRNTNNPNLKFQTTAGGGELVTIDYQNWADLGTERANAGSSQTSGQESATKGQVFRSRNLSRAGRYTSPFPIWEEGGLSHRVLVSWTLCRIIRPEGGFRPCEESDVDPFPDDDDFDRTNASEVAEPFYGLYILDLNHNSKSPVLLPEVGTALTDPIVISARTEILDSAVNAVPERIGDKTVNNGLDQALVENDLGILNIRSVYDTASLSAIGLQPSQLRGSEEILCDIDTNPVDGIGDTNTGQCNTNTGTTVGLDHMSNVLNTSSDPSRIEDSSAAVAVPPVLNNPALNLKQRPVRFVRLVSTMPLYADIENEINDYDGVTGIKMRSILGYAQVEADGSVVTEVPSDTPFYIELLDSKGRKFGTSNSIHDNWLQVKSGDTFNCTGCHEGHSVGTALNQGSAITLTTAGAFAHTLDAMAPTQGETLAETRVRQSCANDGCAARGLQHSLIFQDDWTDAAKTQLSAINRGKDATYLVQYNDNDGDANDDGLTTPSPVFPNVRAAVCGGDPTDTVPPIDQGTWTADCRIVVDYEKHIQPLWDKNRGAGVTCTECHNSIDVNNANIPMVPAGESQLDLTSNGLRDVQNNNDAWLFISYGELTRPGFEHELDGGGMLVRRQVLVDQIVQQPVDADMDGQQDVDANGNLVFVDVTIQVLVDAPRLSPAIGTNIFSRRSYFMEVLTGEDLSTRVRNSNTVDHTTFMTRAELRLVTEWMELGLQYKNDTNDMLP